MRVTLMGTSGWMPSDQRETTCFGCCAGESLFIFDAGTGLRRLREPAQAALLDGARDVHLFLTHYHLDHVCGLAYLPGVLPGRALVIHAPAAELAEGVGLLLHETWYNAADPRTDETQEELRAGYAAHSEVGAVAGLAADAGVGRLVLMHLNPLYDESYYASMEAAARAVFPRSDVLPDGAVIDTEGVA